MFVYTFVYEVCICTAALFTVSIISGRLLWKLQLEPVNTGWFQADIKPPDTFLHENFNSEFRRQHRDNTCYWINATAFFTRLTGSGWREEGCAQETGGGDWTRSESCLPSAQEDRDPPKRSLPPPEQTWWLLWGWSGWYRNLPLKWSSVSVSPLKSESKKKIKSCSSF